MVNKKTKYLRVRFDEYEYGKLAKRAERLGMTLSEYVRQMIDRGERSGHSEAPGRIDTATDW